MLPRLKYHAEQYRLLHSPARFKVVPAGRRGGKTIIAKVNLISKMYKGSIYGNGRYFCSAPTYAQAREIYWDDLKRYINKKLIANISESRLIIKLINNSEVHILGMDKPERVEGPPWDGCILDEYANMKKSTWSEHVRPALSDRKGWGWFIGVPEGLGHYHDLYQEALNEDKLGWDGFTWTSAEILDSEEIEAARQDLDELTFQQEYEAKFINFQGCVYYSFDRNIHAKYKLKYNYDWPLILCFDFNIAPGVCSIIQEQLLPGINEKGTGIIDEIHIKQNSNTEKVCKEVLKKYDNHRGQVICYGDATGGSGGSAKLHGSDWDIIKENLIRVFGPRLNFKVKKSNPRERQRVNAVNSRLMNANGDIKLLIDPNCVYTIKDFEGVSVKQDGSGAIDKNKNPELSHISDSIGYYIFKEYPLQKNSKVTGR